MSGGKRAAGGKCVARREARGPAGNPPPAGAEETGAPLAVLFVDLDGFQTVNDDLGHTVGDRLLVQVGRRLAGCARGFTARMGGDEFTVLLEGLAGPEDLEGQILRLHECMQAPFPLAERSLEIGASVGAALYGGCLDGRPDCPARPAEPGGGDGRGGAGRAAVETGAHPAEDDDGVEAVGRSLLRWADIALRRAKRNAAKRWHVFEPGVDEDRDGLLGRTETVRAALREGRFTTHYQPVFDLLSGEVAAVESLARWKHPTRGLLPPSEFIPVAEETGLIVPLGEALLRQATRDAAAWRRAAAARSDGSGPPPLLVNMSARQLDDPELPEKVGAALEESGLEPGGLQLEITETALLRGGDAVARLRAMGVAVVVDDFGTGYSSLKYLRAFPVDGLKIDRCFTEGLGRDRVSEAIVRTIVTLGDTLGIRVVGEGLETEQQRLGLLAAGCRLGQGYLLARPMPAGELAALLDAGDC